jgi:flavin-dependent dehydrogenase
LFAAVLLARAGVPVRIFERRECIEPEPRTLIVTQELTRVLGPAALGAVLNRVHTLELLTNGTRVPLNLQAPDLVVERATLIKLLARQAVQLGARLDLGHVFEHMCPYRDGAAVHVRQRGTDRVEVVSAQAVIAADGARSAVARTVGRPRRSVVSVLQARVALPRPVDPGVGRVWFAPDDTPFFYWLCPESREEAAVGLVAGDPRETQSKLDRFLGRYGMQPIEYQAALVPLYTPSVAPAERVGSADVLMVGDAAGHVKVTTVGGTVTGLRGAAAAARAVTAGGSYGRELRHVERELRLHWRIRRLMNHFTEQDYDTALRSLNGRAGRLFEVHNRDRLAGTALSILAVQPRLPWLAAHVLLRSRFGA